LFPNKELQKANRLSKAGEVCKGKFGALEDKKNKKAGNLEMRVLGGDLGGRNGI
jgi:hypothetical protein